jgi:YggT family protein
MAIRQILDFAFSAVYLMLMVRILISWIPHNRFHPLVSLLYQYTDPILKPFQNIFPSSMGIDFSPILAFLFLGILKNILFQIF